MLELYADKSPWQAYFRALKWTVGSLDEDNKLVKFLDGFRVVMAKFGSVQFLGCFC
jgi:hypothetical protein